MRGRLANLAAAALMFAAAETAVAATPLLHSVGSVTRHAQQYLNQSVVLRGYLLAREGGYILFSDEPSGKVSRYDLPVVGEGIDLMKPGKRYRVEGLFLDHGLVASNGSPVHLELSTPPTVVP